MFYKFRVWITFSVGSFAKRIILQNINVTIKNESLRLNDISRDNVVSFHWCGALLWIRNDFWDVYVWFWLMKSRGKWNLSRMSVNWPVTVVYPVYTLYFTCLTNTQCTLKQVILRIGANYNHERTSGVSQLSSLRSLWKPLKDETRKEEWKKKNQENKPIKTGIERDNSY